MSAASAPLRSAERAIGSDWARLVRFGEWNDGPDSPVAFAAHDTNRSMTHRPAPGVLSAARIRLLRRLRRRAHRRRPLLPPLRHPARPGRPRQSRPAPAAASGGQLPPRGASRSLALLALVAAFAGKNFGGPRARRSAARPTPLPTTAIDGAGHRRHGAAARRTSRNMSPSERASRLFIRVMTYAERGKVDSAQFLPMAIAAHEHDRRDPSIDERYHLARVGRGRRRHGRPCAHRPTRSSHERPTSLLGLMLAGSRAAR